LQEHQRNMEQYCLYHVRRESLCKKYEICLVVTYAEGRDWQGKGRGEDSVAELWICCNTSQLLTNQNLKVQVFWYVMPCCLIYRNRFCREQCLCSGSGNPVLLDCLTADTPTIMTVTIYHSIRCNTAVTATELENLNLPIGQWNCWQRVESADGFFNRAMSWY